MAKGSASERETCKTLSLWWTDGERDDIFWRTAGSGSRATMRMKSSVDTKYQYGDITFTDPIGKPLIDLLLIENKSGYKDTISVLDFVDSPKKIPQLTKWMEKAEKERRDAERPYSVIIFRRTRKSKCILIPIDLFSLIESYSGIYLGPMIRFYKHREVTNYMIVEFEPFLHWFHPAQQAVKFLTFNSKMKGKMGFTFHNKNFNSKPKKLIRRKK